MCPANQTKHKLLLSSFFDLCASSCREPGCYYLHQGGSRFFENSLAMPAHVTCSTHDLQQPIRMRCCPHPSPALYVMCVHVNALNKYWFCYHCWHADLWPSAFARPCSLAIVRNQGFAPRSLPLPRRFATAAAYNNDLQY